MPRFQPDCVCNLRADCGVFFREAFFAECFAGRFFLLASFRHQRAVYFIMNRARP